MKVEITTVVDTTGTDQVATAVKEQLAGGQGPIHMALEKSAEAYREQLQQRFNSGANWAALSPATIKRKGHNRILIDSGILMGSLTPQYVGAPGQWQQFVDGGVEIGIANYTYPGGIQIEQLVDIHQYGLGTCPKREIVVEPNQNTVAKMTALMDAALVKITGDANGK